MSNKEISAFSHSSEIVNPTLREAFQETDPTFDAFLYNLDTISEEIKRLEAYLQEKGIVVQSHHLFERFEQGSYPHSRDIAKCISWLFHEKSKRWRLMYTIWVDGEPPCGTDNDMVPLIETQKKIRLEANKHLGDFLRGLAKDVTASTKSTLSPEA